MLNSKTKSEFQEWWETATKDERVDVLRELGVYAYYFTPMRQCCMDNMAQMLIDMVNVFNNNDLHYWFDFGGLLGIFRSGELIPYDKDLDIGIYWENIDKYNALIPQLEAKGYRVQRIIREKLDQPDDFVPRVHLGLDKGHCADIVACDIFVWQNVRKKGGRISVALNHGTPCFCDSAYYEDTAWLTWKGANIKIPVCTEEYLEMRYGSKWKLADPLYYRHNIIGSAARCIKQ